MRTSTIVSAIALTGSAVLAAPAIPSNSQVEAQAAEKRWKLPDATWVALKDTVENQKKNGNLKRWHLPDATWVAAKNAIANNKKPKKRSEGSRKSKYDSDSESSGDESGSESDDEDAIPARAYMQNPAVRRVKRDILRGRGKHHKDDSDSDSDDDKARVTSSIFSKGPKRLARRNDDKSAKPKKESKPKKEGGSSSESSASSSDEEDKKKPGHEHKGHRHHGHKQPVVPSSNSTIAASASMSDVN